MTKIKEIIDKYDVENGPYGRHLSDNSKEINQMMKEYAEYYANQFREHLISNGYCDEYGTLNIDPITIQTLPLQPHE